MLDPEVVHQKTMFDRFLLRSIICRVETFEKRFEKFNFILPKMACKSMMSLNYVHFCARYC